MVIQKTVPAEDAQQKMRKESKSITTKSQRRTKQGIKGIKEGGNSLKRVKDGKMKITSPSVVVNYIYQFE